PALAAACNDWTVHLWDPASDDQLRRLQGHSDAVNGVCALVVDGRPLLATASSDQTVALWDAATGEQLRVLHGHTGAVRGACALGPAGPRGPPRATTRRSGPGTRPPASSCGCCPATPARSSGCARWWWTADPRWPPPATTRRYGPGTRPPASSCGCCPATPA